MLAKTKVKEVQVYRSSAIVSRIGEAELVAGRNILYVAGMTDSADTGSFKLKFPEKIRAININQSNLHIILTNPYPLNMSRLPKSVVA